MPTRHLQKPFLTDTLFAVLFTLSNNGRRGGGSARRWQRQRRVRRWFCWRRSSARGAPYDCRQAQNARHATDRDLESQRLFFCKCLDLCTSGNRPRSWHEKKVNAWKCAPPTTDHDPSNAPFLLKTVTPVTPVTSVFFCGQELFSIYYQAVTPEFDAALLFSILFPICNCIYFGTDGKREFFSELFYAAECEKCIGNPKSQRQESQWWNVSMALQGLAQRNLHQCILWKVAPSRMLVLQVRKWMRICGKVPLCASPGWWTAQQKV